MLLRLGFVNHSSESMSLCQNFGIANKHYIHVKEKHTINISIHQCYLKVLDVCFDEKKTFLESYSALCHCEKLHYFDTAQESFLTF